MSLCPDNAWGLCACGLLCFVSCAPTPCSYRAIDLQNYNGEEVYVRVGGVHVHCSPPPPHPPHSHITHLPLSWPRILPYVFVFVALCDSFFFTVCAGVLFFPPPMIAITLCRFARHQKIKVRW
jgi:hypothetical protein